jgi:hypothetical protein
MNILKRALVAAGIAAALVAIPAEIAGAYWLGPGPGIGPWRHNYIYDPLYRWGAPGQRSYIRDLYLYGPTYAAWRQNRRHGLWW